MKFDIEVTGDLAGVITLPKQLEFATASSLTKTNKRAQTSVQTTIKKEMIVRGDWWRQDRKFGIKVKPAKRNDLETVLYSLADWLLEAEGFHSGIKKPESGKHLANPDIENTRHGLRNPIKRNEKAKYLLNNTARSKAFKLKTKSGYTLIMQRVGLDSSGNLLRGKKGNLLRGRGKKRPSTLVVKHILVDRAKVPFQPVITRPTVITFALHYDSYFQQELEKALKSAKIK